MFHVGRSGSVAIGDLLHQHPYVFWDGEVYERLFQERERELRRKVGRGDLDVDAIAHLQSRLARHWNGHLVYGFEAKFFHLEILQLDLEDFIRRLDTMEFARFIVLKRKNTLRKVISSLIAHQTGRWHLRAGQQAAEAKVHVDVDRVGIDRTEKGLLQLLSDYEKSFRELDLVVHGRSTLRLTYEDHILPDPLIAYRRACSFLDLVPGSPVVRTHRTNPFKLCDMVENFDEVLRCLRGTRFEWMIHDDQYT